MASSGAPEEDAASARVVGILTQPLGPLHDDMKGNTYFPASYARYVQMSGVRVAVVRCDSSERELRELFGHLSGLVIPGGTQPELQPGNSYYDAMALFTELAAEAFDNDGTEFPIHYTCLGMEAIVRHIEGHTRNLGQFEGACGVPDVLHWTSDAKDAWCLKFVPDDVRAAAERVPVTYEAHSTGIEVSDFEKSQKLSEAFRMVSTTDDKNGKTYVSIVEGKRYPFLVVQFHPEQPCWEYHNPKIPHNVEAIRFSQALSLAFVEKAKQCSHRFEASDKMAELLLAEHQPQHGRGIFDELYVFPEQKRNGC